MTKKSIDFIGELTASQEEQENILRVLCVFRVSQQ
jgi:hypothetical protein